MTRRAIGTVEEEAARARATIARLAVERGARVQQLGDAAQATGHERDIDAYQEAVYGLLTDLDDETIAEIWDVVSDEARNFGRQQGDEENGGLGELTAWALAYEITNDGKSAPSAAHTFELVVENARGDRATYPAQLGPGDRGTDDELAAALVQAFESDPKITGAAIHQRDAGGWSLRVQGIRESKTAPIRLLRAGLHPMPLPRSATAFHDMDRVRAARDLQGKDETDRNTTVQVRRGTYGTIDEQARSYHDRNKPGHNVLWDHGAFGVYETGSLNPASGADAPASAHPRLGVWSHMEGGDVMMVGARRYVFVTEDEDEPGTFTVGLYDGDPWADGEVAGHASIDDFSGSRSAIDEWIKRRAR